MELRVRAVQKSSVKQDGMRFGVDPQEVQVEKRVQVCSKEQSIGHVICVVAPVGKNVSCIEHIFNSPP